MPPKILEMNVLRAASFPKIVLLRLLDFSIREYRSL